MGFGNVAQLVGWLFLDFVLGISKDKKGCFRWFLPLWGSVLATRCGLRCAAFLALVSCVCGCDFLWEGCRQVIVIQGWSGVLGLALVGA